MNRLMLALRITFMSEESEKTAVQVNISEKRKNKVFWFDY